MLKQQFLSNNTRGTDVKILNYCYCDVIKKNPPNFECPSVPNWHQFVLWLQTCLQYEFTKKHCMDAISRYDDLAAGLTSFEQESVIFTSKTQQIFSYLAKNIN